MSGSNIGVIGAGLMGHGIAYLLAAAGHTVAHLRSVSRMARLAAERLKSARELLGGDPALLGRISAHDQMAPAMAGRGLRVRSRAGEAAAQAAAFRRAGSA